MRTLAILPLALVFGCAHQKTETNAQAAPAATPAPVASATGSQTSSRAADDGSDLAACTSVRVHFAFNEADIASSDRDSLERAARCLAAHREVHISIAGNADERGTEEYNMALGDRRAHAVADYLRSLGASEQQVRTLSYGKERPLCSDHDEACWAQNRRAELMADNSAVKPHHKGRHK